MIIKKNYKHLNKSFKHHNHMIYKQHQQQQNDDHSFTTVLYIMSVILLPLLLPLDCVEAVGYSYTRFTGPVAGPEHKIYVYDNANGNTFHRDSNANSNIGDSGALRLDYVAKPEYEFAYGVEDADAHILHNRNEMRDGDAVKGVYSLIDPDGSLRVVKYTADDANGFQAEVIRNGISSLHGPLKHQHNFAAQNPKIISNNNNNYYNNDYIQQQQQQQQQHYQYPSPPSYYPQNLEQLQQINHSPYNPYNQYQQTLPPLKNYNIDDIAAVTGNDGSNNDYSNNENGDDHDGEHLQPQYEVHEKPNHDDHENLEEENDYENNDDSGHKLSNGHDNAYKKKKHYTKENDHDDDYDDDEEDEDEGEDDDNYDDEHDSEELEDYDETVHKHSNNKESGEYY